MRVTDSLHIANLPSNTVTCTVDSVVVESNHKNALIRIASCKRN